MLQATEQQLHLIGRRAAQLEVSVRTQVDEVKRLQADSAAAKGDIERLKAQLAQAETRAVEVDSELQLATQSLRASAGEFAKAQLLKKKYQNTLAELKGHCKAFALCHRSATDVVLSDACTIDVADQATFILDGVSTDVCVESFGLLQSVRDTLEGYNSCYISFGPSKSGKTTAMMGPTGVVRLAIDSLFRSMEELEVTHFNIRLSFGDILMDQFTDHLADFGNVLAMGTTTEIRAVVVQTAEDAIRALDIGMQRMRTSKRPAGHLFVAIAVENFNRRGHFRKGSMIFVDLMGTGGANAPRTTEHQWAVKSVSSFCSAVSQLSNGNRSEAGQQQGGLMRLLQEALGGNCRSTLIAVIGDQSVEEVMSTLTYATLFKTIVNSPTPYDIPAELQRLNLEAAFD